MQQQRLQGNVVQPNQPQPNNHKNSTREQGRRTEHTSTKTQATDHPNTEQPNQEKNASATRDPQRRRTNRQHKTIQRVHKTKAINVEISTSEAHNTRISAYDQWNSSTSRKTT